MVEDLTYFDEGVNYQGMCDQDFQGPESIESHISKPGADMYKHSQSSNRGSSLEHWDQTLSTSLLVSSSKVKISRLKLKPLGGNPELFGRILCLHVKRESGIDEKLIMKSKVIRIRVEKLFLEGVDKNPGPQLSLDLGTCQYHSSGIVPQLGKFPW